MTRIADRLSLIGWLAIVGGALIRVMTEHTMLPYWDIDPLGLLIPETRVTPAMSFAIDGVMCIGSMAILISRMICGMRIAWRSGLLLVLGCILVAWHGLISDPYGAAPGRFSGDPNALVIGSSWVAGFIGAWAIGHLTRNESWRKLTLCTLLGVVFVLLGHGVAYTAVEHAATLQEYKQDPQLFLMARGMEVGSVAALEFERRLSNPEPLGWFGLTNVFATFCAAGVGGGTGLLLATILLDKRRLYESWLIAVAGTMLGMAGFVGLCLSGSKGGFGVALIGFAVVVCAVVAQRSSARVDHIGGQVRRSYWWAMRHYAGTLAGLFVLAIPLVMVIARGALGERIEELSLLFRWHYLIAAGRMFFEHPVFGVGPGAFQDVFLVTKPPINPEAASSPHNLVAEWIATLGLAGILISAVWCWFVFASVRQGFTQSGCDESESQTELRGALLGVLVAAGASFSAWTLDAPVASDASLAGRILGLCLWIGFLLVVYRESPCRFTLALFGAGAIAAVGSHSMLEVTSTHPGGGAWCLILVATCWMGHQSSGKNHVRKLERLAEVGIVVALILWIGLVTWAGMRAAEWEGSLRSGRVTVDQLVARGKVVEAIEVSAQTMAKAEAIWRGRLDLRVREIMYVISLRREPSDEALFASEALIDDFPGRAEAWLLLAEVLIDRRSGSGSDFQIQASLERASELDPWSIQIPLRGVRASIAMGDMGSSSAWAARTLELDRLLRLDPLKQLNESDRDWLRGIVREDPLVAP